MILRLATNLPTCCSSCKLFYLKNLFILSCDQYQSTDHVTVAGCLCTHLAQKHVWALHNPPVSFSLQNLISCTPEPWSFACANHPGLRKTAPETGVTGHLNCHQVLGPPLVFLVCRKSGWTTMVCSFQRRPSYCKVQHTNFLWSAELQVGWSCYYSHSLAYPDQRLFLPLFCGSGWGSIQPSTWTTDYNQPLCEKSTVPRETQVAICTLLLGFWLSDFALYLSLLKGL